MAIQDAVSHSIRKARVEFGLDTARVWRMAGSNVNSRFSSPIFIALGQLVFSCSYSSQESIGRVGLDHGIGLGFPKKSKDLFLSKGPARIWHSASFLSFWRRKCFLILAHSVYKM